MAWSGRERTAAAGNIGIGGIGAPKAPPPWIPPSSIIVPGEVDPFKGCGGE